MQYSPGGHGLGTQIATECVWKEALHMPCGMPCICVDTCLTYALHVLCGMPCMCVDTHLTYAQRFGLYHILVIATIAIIDIITSIAIIAIRRVWGGGGCGWRHHQHDDDDDDDENDDDDDDDDDDDVVVRASEMKSTEIPRHLVHCMLFQFGRVLRG